MAAAVVEAGPEDVARVLVGVVSMLAAQLTDGCVGVAHRICIPITCHTVWMPYTVSYCLLLGVEPLS